MISGIFSFIGFLAVVYVIAGIYNAVKVYKNNKDEYSNVELKHLLYMHAFNVVTWPFPLIAEE